jgi:hypothetical protein
MHGENRYEHAFDDRMLGTQALESPAIEGERLDRRNCDDTGASAAAAVEEGQLADGVWRAHHVYRRDLAEGGRDLDDDKPAREEVQTLARVALMEQCLAPSKAASNARLDHPAAIAFTKPIE